MDNEQSSSANKDQEPNMSERRDIVPGGPAQEEVEEVNKPGRPLRRPGFLGKIINTALGLSIAAGGVIALKAKAEENAVSQTPPQVEPSNNQEIQNTPPSAPGVKVEFPTADAPVPDAPAEVEFKPTNRIFLPKVDKNHSEAPLRFLTRIERPDANLTIFMDKEESVRRGGLFENLVGFRKRFGPNLPLEVHFYESLDELQRRFGNSSGIPWNQRIVRLIPYGAWASKANIYDDQGNYIETRQFPPIFESDGQIQYRARDSQVVEVHVSLPKLLPGAQPDPLQIERVECSSQWEVMTEVFTVDENGKSILSKMSGTSDSARALGREVGQYLRNNPVCTLKPNQRLDQVALHVIP